MSVKTTAAFESKLLHSRTFPIVDDRLAELADTQHAMFTCDRQGDVSRFNNHLKQQYLEEFLGLENVDYRVCMYCHLFGVPTDGDEWPLTAVCPDCMDELPREPEAYERAAETETGP